MISITVTKPIWDHAWECALNELDRIKLNEVKTYSYEELHRKFHYEMVILKQRLEKL
jgi:hypothetical protein